MRAFERWPVAYGLAAGTALLIGGGCGDGSDGPGIVDEALCPDVDGLADDDRDFIATEDEGFGDTDRDGVPDFLDDDSDGDGLPDAVEAGDEFCSTAPFDTDGDGRFDYLDLDSNGDGVDDVERDESDTDGDGELDYIDRDVDGDGIPNWVEAGPDGLPIDSDVDGIADYLDLDSDGDLVLDVNEGDLDFDGDDIPNFRDLDSDGDGLGDTIEAGDELLDTPPVGCEVELDVRWNQEQDGLPPRFAADGLLDFVDQDSDNDGLTDGEEEALGTAKCGWDTDGDGLSDLVEAAYERVNCPDGPDAPDARGCGCALDGACVIPETDFFVVLPYDADPIVRPLEFGTTIRTADVFFLTDTTGSMTGTLRNVQDTVVDLIDDINAIIPDAWYGGGAHDDFPFSPYGSAPSGDVAFRLTSPVLSPDRKDEVQNAFAAIDTNFGNDAPESQTEALFQVMTGEGGTWTSSGATYTMPAYGDSCVEEGQGAPCFRPLALPIVIHFTDVCSHAEPPGGSSSCNGYSGITPAPHTWTETILEMNKRGAKFIGVNATSNECGAAAPTGFSPCYFLTQTAEATSSVDLTREPLVFDLPNSASSGDFRETIVDAVDRIATRVPLDVDTTVRDDPSDLVDARDFIRERRPACEYNRVADPLPEEPCWTAPEGLTPEEAVAFVDGSTFFDIIPGTRVTFDITFQNLTVEPDEVARVYVAFIDVRGDGSAVLDTRQVIIVVPGGVRGGNR